MLHAKQLLKKAFTFIFGSKSNVSSEDFLRDILVIFIALLATAILFIVAFLSWMDGDIHTATIDAIVGCLIFILVIIYRYSRYKVHCRYLGVFFTYSLYLYLFWSEAAEGLTFMWHYTFPFFAIFLIGTRNGAIATLCLFIPVFSLVLYDASTPGEGIYTTLFASRYIPSVSVALVFAYLFERERERFREQTRKAYREQEKIINERTRELKKQIEERESIVEKLRQSQKMEAIGTMASGVAHDLNNILSGVVTYPELIRLDLPSESPLHTPLIAIEDAGKRAASVVTDLLTLARNAASVKEATDVNHLVREILESPEWKNFFLPYERVRIITELSRLPAAVTCSPAHIRKCLMNLLINGVEATAPAGKVTLSTWYDEVSNRVTISILDEGPGIAEEHLAHIFEPFYTTKKMGRSGSGLGLAVVWNTIEEHAGKISVENRKRGACFSIELPSADPSTIFSSENEGDTFEDFRGDEAILIVDDEEQPRNIASNIVSKLGYAVTVVENGEEAVKHISEQTTDLILLDMVLGEGMTGLETFRKIVKINPHQKAIIVSGYSTSDDVQETLALGASGVVKKPYSITDLGRAIKEVLKSR